jgi:RNA recognition motif-containing protein
VKKAGQEITTSVESKQTWMGKGIDGTMFQRGYDAALLDLCREYLAFERQSGSEESFVQAQTLVRSKLLNWDPTAATIAPISNIHDESHGKRKLDADDGTGHPDDSSSKVTVNDDENDEGEFVKGSKRVKVKTDLKQPKKTDGVHKVRIGKLEYPAHPYTIYVSNLSKDTQDMDLVDAFVAEFGAVVHGRILREKKTGKGGHHFHGESKCAGLIQFEDRSSVENALRMDGQFEVGGRPVKTQRSHLPAVGLVPQGMHRVSPKGEGKVSKRNQVKKKLNDDGMEVEEKCKGGDQFMESNEKQMVQSTSTTTSPSSLSLSVLSFKPRGMRQKPKISLDSSSTKK